MATAFGKQAAKSNSVVVSKSDGLLIEIDRTSDNNPPGFVYYITIYHETAGIYYPEFVAASIPARQIVV